mmetsp:Transcript_27278/g.46320  ORF Transcript_27278/g.46320 Transcript_27278/m.46320 type:complete len:233 (-) Transcript_27278:215-913(-)
MRTNLRLWASAWTKNRTTAHMPTPRIGTAGITVVGLMIGTTLGTGTADTKAKAAKVPQRARARARAKARARARARGPHGIPRIRPLDLPQNIRKHLPMESPTTKCGCPRRSWTLSPVWIWRCLIQHLGRSGLPRIWCGLSQRHPETRVRQFRIRRLSLSSALEGLCENSRSARKVPLAPEHWPSPLALWMELEGIKQVVLGFANPGSMHRLPLVLAVCHRYARSNFVPQPTR